MYLSSYLIPDGLSYVMRTSLSLLIFGGVDIIFYECYSFVSDGFME